MGFDGGAPPLHFRLFLCTTTFLLTFSQGMKTYPFIEPASSFSDGAGYAYDYIIVGGGTAGCPLAATLSLNYTVLVLERGGTPFGNSNVSFMENFLMTLNDFSDTSASQIFVSTDGVINSRARILGGGTCINAGFYSQADPRFMKRVGWDRKLVKESYRWIEDQIVYEPKVTQFQKAVRDGLLEIGISPYNGFTYNHKYGTKIGGTIFDRSGRRHTAVELLASGRPDNLRVLVHATVLKIEFDTSGKMARAVGVMFKDEKGERHRARVSGRRESEIVVSCGAIGSPQLLMLSGVGPATELKRNKISVVVENEFVGKGMSDNPQNRIFVPLKGSVEQSLIQTVGITKLGVYIEASSGFGSNDQARTINETNNNNNDPLMGGFILEKVAYPLSRGELTLNTTNIDDNPSVTFNYFSHPADVARCVDGILLIYRILNSTHFSNYTKFGTETEKRLMGMESLEQFCRDTVMTIWHYHGGCQVGRVVDANYRVFKVEGLRVVDGSTFYDSPGTNPQATVMMMGRYVGVKMLRERLGKAAAL